MTKMQPKKGSAMTSCCSVCSAPSASHLHYGAVSCYSCRAFFRRGLHKPYCCVEGTGDCRIDWTSRRSCQWCRFDKCLKVGMNPALVDKSLKMKIINKNKTKDDDPNLEQLKHSEIVSNVLMDLSYESPDNLFQTVPS